MTLLVVAIMVIAQAAGAVTLEERIDLFEPTTGAFLGAERTWFGPDGRRLRWQITDAQGATTLLFFVLHDERGREAEAIYFEEGAELPSRETFTYSDKERTQTTTYYSEPGVAGERTEIDMDAEGRETRKRYYRKDGSQYGEEDVLWDTNGNQLGWDFRYVGRDGGASFRYDNESLDTDGGWVRRIRSRNGVPERLEVRSRIGATTEHVLPTPAPFAPGQVSTKQSETSPSFSRDGKTMVFARYDENWTIKDPFIAHLGKGGWQVEPLTGIGSVYNLAISPDGSTIIYSTRSDESRLLFRVRRDERGWSRPENLSNEYGLSGTYACLANQGVLFFYDAEGPSGAGIYSAPPNGDGFGKPAPVYVPSSGSPFDAYTSDGIRTLLVTRCFDDVCESGPKNGIWEVALDDSGVGEERKLPNLPYAWGAQPVESLGLFVFTDGDDILAIPLESAGLGQ